MFFQETNDATSLLSTLNSYQNAEMAFEPLELIWEEGGVSTDVLWDENGIMTEVDEVGWRGRWR